MSDIDHLLTSKDSALRAYGRLLATQIGSNAADWILSERDRGTNPVDIISAITIFASSLSSGILVLTSSGSIELQKAIVSCFETFLKHDVARGLESLK